MLVLPAVDAASMARDPATAPDQLWELAHRQSLVVQLALVNNPSCPTDLLQFIREKGCKFMVRAEAGRFLFHRQYGFWPSSR